MCDLFCMESVRPSVQVGNVAEFVVVGCVLFGMEFSHSKNAFLLNLLEVLRKDEKRIKEAGKAH